MSVTISGTTGLSNVPAGSIAATNTQAAVNELDTEKAALAGSASQTFSASTLNGAPIKHHNDIINGSFRVAQAGTSFAAPLDGAYDLDGWVSMNPSAAVFTVAQAAGSTTGKLCRTTTVTTADASVAAGDYVNQATRIEGYNAVKYIGNTFSIGFKVRSAVTGIHCLALYDVTSSYVVEYTINAANTWETKSVTITGGLQAVASSTNAVALYLYWSNMCGSTYQTTAGAWNAGFKFATANQVNDMATIGNVFALEDVTMNLGTVAAVDEISYEDELRRCQRYRRYGVYAQYIYAGLGINAGGTTVDYLVMSLPAPMRTTPTVGVTNVTVSGVAVTSATAATHPNNNDVMLTLNGTGFTAISNLPVYGSTAAGMIIDLRAQL